MTALLLMSLLLAVGPVHAAPITEVHYVMGTYFRITAEGEGSRSAMRRCFSEARRLDAVFSRFDPASELVRVNAGAGEPLRVGPDMRRLLARAQALSAARLLSPRLTRALVTPAARKISVHTSTAWPLAIPSKSRRVPAASRSVSPRSRARS